MALAVWPRTTPPSRRLAEQVREVRETGEEALASLGEYLSRRRARPARSAREGAMAFIAGLVLGILVAGMVALLLAPSDGATLRRRILSRLDELLGIELSGLAPAAGGPGAPGQADQGLEQPAMSPESPDAEASSPAPSSASAPAAG
jgi:hypothetical protein